jgi:hypothetical protein
VPPPGQDDRRVSHAPRAGGKTIQSGGAGLGILGFVDLPRSRRDGLAVLAGHKGERVPKEMDHAGLHLSLREDRRDRVGEALEAIDDRDEDVLDAGPKLRFEP